MSGNEAIKDILKNKKTNFNKLNKNVFRIVNLIKKSQRPLFIIGNGIKISNSEDLIKREDLYIKRKELSEVRIEKSKEEIISESFLSTTSSSWHFP